MLKSRFAKVPKFFIPALAGLNPAAREALTRNKSNLLKTGSKTKC
jgi:hypothetical protein